jgi:mRNA interferase HicA
MKRRDLLRHLAACGVSLEREGSRHSWYENIAARRRAAVPRHAEISNFLALKICRELGIAAPPSF